MVVLPGSYVVTDMGFAAYRSLLHSRFIFHSAVLLRAQFIDVHAFMCVYLVIIKGECAGVLSPQVLVTCRQ